MARLKAPPKSPSFKLTRWPQGDALYRVHSDEFGPLAFNPGKGKGRFHPIQDVRGRSVPTLYAGADFETALFETAFRELPRGSTVFESELEGYERSIIVARRDLTLMELYADGLRALGVSAKALLEGDTDSYQATASWAAALHRASVADGMIWRSRQRPQHDALVLWGDRIARHHLRVTTVPPYILHGALRARVFSLAADYDIIVTPDN